MTAWRQNWARCIAALAALVVGWGVLAAPPVQAAAPGTGEPVVGPRYDLGAPTLAELWVDPVVGDDSRPGTSRSAPLATISAAWAKVPQGPALTGTGYRINLLPGVYPESTFPLYWEERQGTAQFPIILRAVDGPGTVRLEGFFNVYRVSHFYLIDLEVRTPGDVFHCELCDHILLRRVVLDGGARQAHEVIKVNQSQHLYVEDSDIFGAYENAVDFVAVQHGHIVGNRLHAGDDWCIYLKGGSAYFLVAYNEIYDCGTGGFSAGQGTGFEFMTPPWLQYEAYDVKFVDNVVHDTEGAGFGVNGGYNILLAYNTLYRVGARSHAVEVVFGGRTCDGDTEACRVRQEQGGWGTAEGGDNPIPNRNVYIYNNLVYNPPGYQSRWQHFAVYGPRTPSPDSNIPSPARTDDNLRIAGNWIWNGPADLDLGLGGEQGCAADHPTCSPAQVLSANSINAALPGLTDPAAGDFSPVTTTAAIAAVPIPDFPAWTPPVPPGDPANTVAVDAAGVPRTPGGWPGAFGVPSAAVHYRTYLPRLAE